VAEAVGAALARVGVRAPDDPEAAIAGFTDPALAERIDARVDAMVAAGAREEVEAAHAAGASATARRALGFEELLRGDVEAMKTRTRRYAKRQLTWLRKLPGTHLVDVTHRTPEDVAAELDGMI
jgi:tRNA dimethylallyltransferase